MIPDSDDRICDRQHFDIYKLLPHILLPAALTTPLYEGCR